MKPIFISATGTNCGKTYFTCAFARHLAKRGLSPIALKPIETGVSNNALPEDARALAEACGLSLSDCSHPGFYRAQLPVSPDAARRAGEPPLDFPSVLRALHEKTDPRSPTLIEGAGGLFVPLDNTRFVADLALALDAATILIAPDRLGVLSDVIATELAARSRGLRLAAIVLNRIATGDQSQAHNLAILQERLADTLVLPFEEIDSHKTLELLAENLWLSPNRIRE